MVTEMGALAVLLVIAAGLVVTGVALWSTAAALITAGVLLAGLAVGFLVDVPDRAPQRPDGGEE